MLAPCYLVHGHDHQEIFTLVTSIKQQARDQGYNLSEVLEVTTQFAWESLLHKCQNLDLFASKTVLELRLTTDAIDKNATEILTKFLQQQTSDFCIIITAPKLKPATLNAAWVQHIQKHGKVQTTKAVPPLFRLTNAALAGDAKLVIKLVDGLKNSGTEPILLLWGLVREVKQLLHLKSVQQPSKHYQQAALGRLSTTQLHDLLSFSSKVDCLIKGVIPGNIWEPLLGLYLNFANPDQHPILLEDIATCKA